jgi:preprotein translocase subunit SecB
MSDEAQVSIKRLYVKDCSFESPQSPKLFKGVWKPKLKIDLNNTVNKVSGDDFEVVLTLSITAELEDETAFLVEVQQAGLFMIKGVTEEQFGHAVNVTAASLLFPYIREAIDSLVMRGGFRPLPLQPIDFDAAYQQKMAQQSPPTESH